MQQNLYAALTWWAQQLLATILCILITTLEVMGFVVVIRAVVMPVGLLTIPGVLPVGVLIILVVIVGHVRDFIGPLDVIGFVVGGATLQGESQ